MGGRKEKDRQRKGGFSVIYDDVISAKANSSGRRRPSRCRRPLRGLTGPDWARLTDRHFLLFKWLQYESRRAQRRTEWGGERNGTALDERVSCSLVL